MYRSHGDDGKRKREREEEKEERNISYALIGMNVLILFKK